MRKKLKKLKEIFFTFFKIGLFTFGGGYAMIPLIERETAEKKKWVKQEEITDIIAVSQSVPGAVAINLSTFIGYRIMGKIGAITAAAGVILPSFLVILAIAMFFSRFGNNPFVKAFFAGVRPAVVALIIIAAINVGKSAIRDKIGTAVTIITVILVSFFKIHPIIAISTGGIFGFAVYKLWPSKVKEITDKKDGGNDLY
ncbi:chromate transporter [Thermoclostridium stercorarium subsp. thermolacticum DSM 2910]|nr:chromate transporter [Thermoclostridium stercorarium]ANW98158.1 chromate transporter [Thermoclostridium stercorarium subsp. thermolacticum DSM 2910]ANX00700.1 chromate transporter [Thermoclostridium stercorarium subsp. leptospartum DSM 9219]UZQ86313.1 chromate transporter [Thermoclostridium stercorarium]